MSNPESGDIEPFDWFNNFFGGRMGVITNNGMANNNYPFSDTIYEDTTSQFPVI